MKSNSWSFSAHITIAESYLWSLGHTNAEDNDFDDNGDAQARRCQETGEDPRTRASDRQVPLLSVSRIWAPH